MYLRLVPGAEHEEPDQAGWEVQEGVNQPKQE
jgi:hypothetical protein